jgi:replicative DNA helicase
MSAATAPKPAEASEKVIVSCMFQDPDNVCPAVAKRVGVDAFRNATHRALAQLLLDRHNANEPCDLLSITQYLTNTGQIEKFGGPYELTDLATQASNIGLFQSHMQTLQTAAVRYRIWKLGNALVQQSVETADDTKTPEEILAESEQMLMDLRSTHSQGGVNKLIHVQKATQEALKIAEELFKNKGQIQGIPSGYISLDRTTCGWRNSDLIILAARPSIGKSALALNFALNGARAGHGCVFFSFEMSTIENAQRICSQSVNVNLQRFSDGMFTKADFTRLTPHFHDVKKLPLWMANASGMTVYDIRAAIRRAVKQQEIKFAIIDYLQLVKAIKKSKSGTREQEVAEITGVLKSTAMELDIPIIALSQLSRDAAKAERPKLHHLRESGAIEQDANVVMLLHRELGGNQSDGSGEKTKDPEADTFAELEIAKQRNGKQGTIIHLKYRKEFTRFEDLPNQPEP